MEALDCCEHGKAFQTFMCSHLTCAPTPDWFSAKSDAENEYPDVWCDSCHKAYEAAGEWNESNEALLNIQLICHHCYTNFKARSPKVTIV